MKLQPDDFQLELSSVWSFPNRGTWATHDAKYRGNWSPYIPRNIMMRYSKENDLVLDQFVGGGTTLVEAKLLNRNCIGVDVNIEAIERCKEKCNFDAHNNATITITKGDALNLDFIKDDNIDLICAHPPYGNIIKYSEGNEKDISLYKLKDYLIKMQDVASECFRVLKKDKFCAILIGDTRSKGHIIPLGFSVLKIFENAGFKLKEIIIKEQFNCKSSSYWKSSSIKYNFLLIAHEYLFVFKK